MQQHSVRVRGNLALLTFTGNSSLVRADVPEHVIPQRGLGKAYQNERVRHLPGSVSFLQRVQSTESREGIPWVDADVPVSVNEALVEMQGVVVSYEDKEVLGDWEQEIEGRTKRGLSWIVRRGERWGVFGPNGTYSMVHEDIKPELNDTRIRENNTPLFDLLRSSSSLLFTYQGLWTRSFATTRTAWYIHF